MCKWNTSGESVALHLELNGIVALVITPRACIVRGFRWVMNLHPQLSNQSSRRLYWAGTEAALRWNGLIFVYSKRNVC